ncbi:MAG TPA: hypothetical protein VGN48_13785 [Pedococcus sp.]|jgi:hypothetical protein|nr:hypothetical protein [Pedococcus sp.]
MVSRQTVRPLTISHNLERYAVGKSEREGLSLGYRLRYRLRRMILQIYGPAQLGESQDPLAKLANERAAKVEAARLAAARRSST